MFYFIFIIIVLIKKFFLDIVLLLDRFDFDSDGNKLRILKINI